MSLKPRTSSNIYRRSKVQQTKRETNGWGKKRTGLLELRAWWIKMNLIGRLAVDRGP